MKSILYRLLPGVAATLLILAFGAIVSLKSQAQGDPRPTLSPLPSAVAAEPVAVVPRGYVSAPPRDCSRGDSGRSYQHQPAYSCAQCGAPIDGAGRYVSDGYALRERDGAAAPQVVYVVHVNAGNGYPPDDLRAWPQPIFPMSTRFALPIRTACR